MKRRLYPEEAHAILLLVLAFVLSAALVWGP